MKRKNDIKFIIYQSLYIFVICVIAMKGANLDLTQVVEDDGKVKADISPDSLQKLIEILKRSIIVDTNLYVIISKEDLSKLSPEQQKLVSTSQPQLSVTSVTPQITNTNTTNNPLVEKIDQKPEVKKDPGEMKEIRIGNIQLTQFTNNTLNNPYDSPLEIVGITSIPPHSSKTFVTGGESSVVIKVGDQTKTVEMKPNEKPKINFQTVGSMGENARVTQLQSGVGFRVTITDDFPGQLDVKFSGPVTVKQTGNTYDVTMNAFSSKGAFDNFTDGKEAPYSVGFTVSVTDKIAGHKITGQNSFRFGEW